MVGVEDRGQGGDGVTVDDEVRSALGGVGDPGHGGDVRGCATASLGLAVVAVERD